MKKKKFRTIAHKVIETEINALKKLKRSLSASFDEAVEAILNCKTGKVVVSGVGKSGIIGKKISSTLASVGTPSFYVDASACSHGDLGQISSNDILILISLSGQSDELKNVIQYAVRNKKITLICITSKKDSILYKNSDIKILTPNVIEAGPGNIVPTSSTIMQLSIGDALAISCMKYKKFGKLDFKKYHPGGTLSVKLKTAEDLMVKGINIPMVKSNNLMKDALKIITKKKLGVVIVQEKNNTVGILTDGDIKRATQKNINLHIKKVKDVMTKKPITVDKNILAAEALSIMNNKKITSLCVHKNNNKKKTIGLLHIHQILNANIQ